MAGQAPWPRHWRLTLAATAGLGVGAGLLLARLCKRAPGSQPDPPPPPAADCRNAPARETGEDLGATSLPLPFFLCKDAEELEVRGRS